MQQLLYELSDPLPDTYNGISALHDNKASYGSFAHQQDYLNRVQAILPSLRPDTPLPANNNSIGNRLPGRSMRGLSSRWTNYSAEPTIKPEDNYSSIYR